jgi:uncharacterized protein
MSASNPQHEPTMEEILASIRKIISEDQPEPAKPAAGASEQAQESSQKSEPEVLDLTDEIGEDGSIRPVSAQAQPSGNVPPSRQYDQDVQFANIDEPPETQRASDSLMDPDDLISDSTRSAVGRVFDSLDDDEPATSRAAMPSVSGNSVEAVFQRAILQAFEPTLQQWVDGHQSDILNGLKPIIREWMDQNLPPLIEAAVHQEISRAVRSRRR